MKKILLNILMLSVLIMTIGSVSAATLFSDNFDSYSVGNDGQLQSAGWEARYFEQPGSGGNVGDTAWFDVETISSTSDTSPNSVRIEDDAAFYHSIDTVGYENIEFSYCRRTESTTDYDILRIGWKESPSSYDWEDWQELNSIREDWDCETYSLSPDADDTTIYIGFFMDDGEGDYGIVDSIEVTGDEIDTIPPTISNIQHVPEYPICSDNVQICAEITDNSEINVVRISWNNGADSGLSVMNHVTGNTYCRTLSHDTLNAIDEMSITYSIYAEDEKGNYDETSTSNYIYDCANPTAEFLCTPLSGNEDLTVTCTSSSSDTVTPTNELDYSWTFGNGETSNAQNPSLTYIEDGLYTVSLTVTDNAGHTDTETKTEYIDVLDIGPEASFTESLHEFGESESVDFTDISTSHDPFLSWTWDFGDGETSNAQNPSHTYADNGIYTVTLTVCDEDNDCDVASDTKNVINEAPNVNAGEYICNEGETISLDSATATDVIADYPLLFEWDLDGDDIYETSGQVVPYLCGNGYAYINDIVALKVTDKDGGWSIDEAEITINNIPPIADAHGPYNAVKGESICFIGSATDVIDTSFTYRWDFDYDITFDNDGTGEGPCTTYSEIGTYTIALIANDGTEDSEIVTTTINVYEYSIPLQIGWNLISIPLVPENDNTHINFVFNSDISENAEVIWEYKYDESSGMNVWRYNLPTNDGAEWTADNSRVQSIIPGYGYYIKMISESEIYQNGNKFYGIGGLVPQPPQVQLTPGWNLIGHYGMNEVAKSSEVQDLSGGILTDLAVITLIDENGIPSIVLVPTEGYWAFITGQNNLLYAPSEADYN